MIFDFPVGSLLCLPLRSLNLASLPFLYLLYLSSFPICNFYRAVNRAIISCSFSMESGGPPAEGDANQSTSIRIYTTILITFTIVIVALRFVVRKWITKIIGWDDWTILLAIVRPVLQLWIAVALS